MAITITVAYPNTPGSTFDMDYYLNNHFNLVGRFWGERLISSRAVKGLATADPDTPPPYQVIAILETDSLDTLQEVMGAHGAEMMADIANFTDVTPKIQISENLG